MAKAIDQQSSSHDLTVLLSSKERDFLICRNGEPVCISEVMLYCHYSFKCFLISLSSVYTSSIVLFKKKKRLNKNKLDH